MTEVEKIIFGSPQREIGVSTDMIVSWAKQVHGEDWELNPFNGVYRSW